jgi:outer membrane autotransporter protein
MYGANSADLVPASDATALTTTPTIIPVMPSSPADPSTPVQPVEIASINTSVFMAPGTAAVLNAQPATAALLDRAGRARSAVAGASEAWIDATGTQTRVGGSAGEPGFQANLQYGFLAGLEHTLGDYTIGVAGGYTHTDLDEATTDYSGTTDTLRAALYGGRWLGPVGVSATIGYGLDLSSSDVTRRRAGRGDAA